MYILLNITVHKSYKLLTNRVDRCMTASTKPWTYVQLICDLRSIQIAMATIASAQQPGLIGITKIRYNLTSYKANCEIDNSGIQEILKLSTPALSVLVLCICVTYAA